MSENQNLNLQLALNQAVQNNDLLAVNELLRQEININDTTDDGWTALHFAAFKGYDKIVDVLLKAGIDSSIKGKVYGRTALHYAVDRGNIEVVRLLLASGADSGIVDNSNKSALDIAQEKGLVEIVQILIN